MFKCVSCKKKRPKEAYQPCLQKQLPQRYPYTVKCRACVSSYDRDKARAKRKPIPKIAGLFECCTCRTMKPQTGYFPGIQRQLPNRSPRPVRCRECYSAAIVARELRRVAVRPTPPRNREGAIKWVAEDITDAPTLHLFSFCIDATRKEAARRRKPPSGMGSIQP